MTAQEPRNERMEQLIDACAEAARLEFMIIDGNAGNPLRPWPETNDAIKDQWRAVARAVMTARAAVVKRYATQDKPPLRKRIFFWGRS